MKLRYIFLFILIALIGVLFFTNPDEQAHKNFLKDKFTELFNQKAEEEINKITATDPQFEIHKKY